MIRNDNQRNDKMKKQHLFSPLTKSGIGTKCGIDVGSKHTIWMTHIDIDVTCQRCINLMKHQIILGKYGYRRIPKNAI